MKYLVFINVMVIVSFARQCSAQTDSFKVVDLSQLFRNNVKSNMQLDKFIGREAYANMKVEDRKAYQTSLANSDIVGYEQTMNQLVSSLKTSNQNNNLGLRALNLGVRGTCYLLDKAKDLDKETRTKMILAGLSVTCSYGLSKLIEMAKEESEKDIQSDLHYRLGQLSDSDKSEAEAAIQNADFAGFINLMNKKADYTDSVTRGLPPEEKEQFVQYRDKLIRDMMGDGQKFLRDIQISQLVQVDSNLLRLQQSSVAILKFDSTNNQQLQSIVESQADIQDKLNELCEKAGKTADGIDFLQEFEFGKMSPDEQIIALNDGRFFPGIDSASRSNMIAAANLVKSKQDLDRQIKQYLGDGHNIANILRNIGLGGIVADDIEKASTIGDDVYSAFTQFGTGNFISAIGSLTNIFGLFGGRDVEGERFKEIMNGMQQIYEGVKVIDTKIDTLMSMDIKIMGSQQKIIDGLVTVSNQIEENHQEEMKQLINIDKDVLYNRDLQLENMSLGWEHCRKLRFTVDGDTLLDLENGIIPSYAVFNQSIKDNLNDCKRCLSILHKTYVPDISGSSPSKFSSLFNLESYKTKDSSGKINVFLNKIYPGVLFILQQYDSENSPQSDSILSSLFAPVLSVNDLLLKLNSGYQNVYNSSFTTLGHFMKLLKTPLYTNPISIQTDHIVNLHLYYHLVDGNRNPISLSELVTNPTLNSQAESDLKECLKLVNIALAQNVLVNGDILLPYIENILNSGDSSNVNNVFKVLQLDHFLSYNYLLYKWNKDIQSNGSYTLYDFAWHIGDTAYISSCSQYKWDYLYLSGDSAISLGNSKDTLKAGWYVKIAGVPYKLPPVKDLEAGKFVYSKDVYDLVSLRDRILNQLATYDIYEETNPSYRSSINKITLTDFKTDPKTENVVY
jgi:hypothetical protein